MTRERELFRGKRVACGWPLQLEHAQSKHFYRSPSGEMVPRIRYGNEGEEWGAQVGPCHDCSAVVGELHVPGCDVERCPSCAGQVIGCDCVTPEELEPKRHGAPSASSSPEAFSQDSEWTRLTGRADLERTAPTTCPLGHDGFTPIPGFRRQCTTCRYEYDLKLREWNNVSDSPNVLGIGSPVRTFFERMREAGYPEKVSYRTCLTADGGRTEMCTIALIIPPDRDPLRLAQEASSHLVGSRSTKERTGRNPATGETIHVSTTIAAPSFEIGLRVIDADVQRLAVSLLHRVELPRSPAA